MLDREANDDFCTPPTSFAHSKRGSVGPVAEDSVDANDGVDERDTGILSLFMCVCVCVYVLKVLSAFWELSISDRL